MRLESFISAPVNPGEEGGGTHVSPKHQEARVHFIDLHPRSDDLCAEVLKGLGQTPKRLPPKLFYDRTGSRLFDAITRLPEYYPTRTEIGILKRHGEAIAAHLGRGKVLIELGSGSSLKIQILLAALRPRLYVPIDISKAHLIESAKVLARRFPELAIQAVCADYSAPLNLPLASDWGERAAFFPGSSIGNFNPPEARAFLRQIAKLLGPGGALLIGVDLIKDRTILEPAYDDAQGVTAAFNLNLLARLNRELGADFDLKGFRHHAFFNATASRIEMHLLSTCPQQVRVAGQVFVFAEGECIHTENSYKYSLEGFQRLAHAAGFVCERVWTDERGWFSVHCLRVEEA